MSAVLSPIVSEFETEEQEASYTVWLKAKVQASLNDPRPNIPHDQVMAKAGAQDTGITELNDIAAQAKTGRYVVIGAYRTPAVKWRTGQRSN